MASIHQVVVDQESRRKAPKKKPAPKAPAEPDDLLAIMGAAILDPNQWSREDARDLVLRALRAAVEQSNTEAAYEKAGRKPRTDVNAKAFEISLELFRVAQRETCAAGAALTKALRTLQGGK